jgi:hypothetical protein
MVDGKSTEEAVEIKLAKPNQPCPDRTCLASGKKNHGFFFFASTIHHQPSTIHRFSNFC